ncbi:hypothetical protein FOZ63_003444, partial [Perkinsus olseni]
EEIRANKQVLKMMSVNVKINAVEARYGSPVAQAAFLLVAQCQTPKDQELEKGSDELRSLMLEIGLIDEASLEETRKKFKEANKFMQEQTTAASTGMQAPSDGRTEATRARLQKKLETRQAEKAAAAESAETSPAATGKKAGKRKNSRKSETSSERSGTKEEKATECPPEEEVRGGNSSEDEKARLNEESDVEELVNYDKLLTVGLAITVAAVGGIFLYRKYFNKKD